MAVINRFWKTVPLRSSILFFVGVFFIFTAIGFASDITEMGRQTTLRLVIGTFITGIFPVFYALSGFLLRKHFWKAMAPIFVIQFVLMDILANTYPSPPQPTQMDAATIARLQSRLSLDGSAIILVVVLGYACLTYVSVSESRRYARALAEIELATEIHGVLVPPIDFKIGGFEFLGRSVPSGEVGGDLIDVATSQDHWVAYLADVSGHGVAPGLVMGMVKSSARMLLSSAAGSGHLMARLNEVLYPLKKPDMFITFCFLAREGGVTRIGLAGHPPILHFSAATGTVTTCESRICLSASCRRASSLATPYRASPATSSRCTLTASSKPPTPPVRSLVSSAFRRSFTSMPANRWTRFIIRCGRASRATVPSSTINPSS
jgi:hypothetical protein